MNSDEGWWLAQLTLLSDLLQDLLRLVLVCNKLFANLSFLPGDVFALLAVFE
ncbi:hypothetical protein M758_6G208700 [Ceratodon purpureus]|uniref:Uncharacterized protein n=1 Tax=Ceratodon purpureus TaxID=3225 RepID=A0A8T0HK72_CERPU|nr:hypothetical protein KC19_6G217900 [Ceratodon purpureus]KAG0614849.1 hypothetical protein M758_6G208700 [Ceratodon purpureus]